MAKKDELKKYREKRDFRKSPEPSGKKSRASKGRKLPRFVIHKHAASRLHYDFRLEADGVLKSWAVPKGPSTDPKEKRLAVLVEDHPLDYGDFEGVIPEDEYGAGAVMVWDAGTYKNLTEDDDGKKQSVDEAIKNGHVKVRLKGKKLKGGYALSRFKKEEGKENWLLVKVDDDEADARRKPTKTEPKSVKSGRTIKEIEEEEGGE